MIKKRQLLASYIEDIDRCLNHLGLVPASDGNAALKFLSKLLSKAERIRTDLRAVSSLLDAAFERRFQELHDGLRRRRKCPVDEILRYAKVSRIQSVVARYLEALA